MKRKTTPVLPVKICLAVTADKVESIDFLFKKEKSPEAYSLLEKGYTKGNIPFGDCDEEGLTVLLPLSETETGALPAGKIYMDTKVVLENGVIPETEIVSFFVKDTLFEGEDA